MQSNCRCHWYTYLNKKSGVYEVRPVERARSKADSFVSPCLRANRVGIALSYLKIWFHTSEFLSVLIPNVRGRAYRVTTSLVDPGSPGFSCEPRPTTREISTAGELNGPSRAFRYIGRKEEALISRVQSVTSPPASRRAFITPCHDPPRFSTYTPDI